MRSRVARLLVLTFAVALPSAFASRASSPPHAARGRLAARPHAPSLGCPAGVQRLGVDPERESLLYVPASVAASAGPSPLVVYLHGATGQAARGLERVRPYAD